MLEPTTLICFLPPATFHCSESRPDVPMASGLSRLVDVFRFQDSSKYLSWLPVGKGDPLPQQTPVADSRSSDSRLPTAPTYGTLSHLVREETDDSLLTLVNSPVLGQQNSGPGAAQSPSPALRPIHDLNKLLSEGIPLPGRKERRWFGRQVQSPAWDVARYEERFQIVLGELKKAVESHKTLCDRPDGFKFSKEMVGISPETSVPTIVVACYKEDEKVLRAWLHKCIPPGLHCTVKPRQPRKSNKMRLEKKVSQFQSETRHSQPPFDIVIDPRFQLARKATEHVILAARPEHQPLCGSLVHFEGRTATLGISLNVEGVHRVLTVDHLFGPLPSPGFTNNALHADQLTTTRLNTAARARSLLDLPESSAYLDWSLIEPQTATSLHNLISPTSNRPPVPLRGLARDPHGQTRIYMVSGLHGVRQGTLLGQMSYISTRRARDLCPVWSMMPDSGTIEKGECGSIIVDKETLQVYGHLIGADEGLGFGYIVPLTKTIEQIKTSFNTNSVEFSDVPPEVLSAFPSPPTTSPTDRDNTGHPRDNGRPAVVSTRVISGSIPTVESISGKAKAMLAWRTISTPLLVVLFAFGAFIPPILLSLPVAPLPYKALPYPQYTHTPLPSQHQPSITTPRKVLRPDQRQLSFDQCFAMDQITTLTLSGSADMYWAGQIYGASDTETWQRYGSNWYADHGPRFMTWILPIFLLLSNIELSPGSKLRFLTFINVLGDPIDTMWSLLAKLHAWSKVQKLASLSATKESRWKTAHSDFRIIATVLSGFDELAGPESGYTGQSQSLVDLFSPDTNYMFEIWREAAVELIDGRTDERVRACLAIALYILQLASVLFEDVKGGTEPSASRLLMPGLILSCIIPIVYLSSTAGIFASRRAALHPLRRFLVNARDAQAAELKSKKDGPNGMAISLNDDTSDLLGLLSSWEGCFDTAHFVGGHSTYLPYAARRETHNLKALSQLFLAICPIIASGIGALLLTRAGPRQTFIFSIIGTWILSTALSLTLRRLARRTTSRWIRQHYPRVYLAKNLIAIASILGLALITTAVMAAGVFNRASIPLYTNPRYAKRDAERAKPVVMGVIAFQLLFVLVVVMANWMADWKGISVFKWSASKHDPQQLPHVKRVKSSRGIVLFCGIWALFDCQKGEFGLIWQIFHSFWPLCSVVLAC